MNSINKWQSLLMPIGIISSVLVILVPLPHWLMDVLLAANIATAVVVVLTTIYVESPLEFSVFPSLLLATTLGRLVMNVATTRLILTQADTLGADAAGGVIRAFGEFVAGDRVVVGLIIFIIIVVIQFVVITKGATRISEVAARFALDGMPGRQMAIDADLNAQAITEDEAKIRREEITQQADFYGAMDGASKFVRGDAIAGIIITIINIIGGLVIGIFESGMGFMEAAQLFTKLTIGDGLVSQVPAFLISLAAALLITRSTAKSNLPLVFMQQIFSNPKALLVAGAFLFILVFTGLPTIPLLSLAGGCCAMAFILSKQTKADATDKAEAEAVAEQEAAQAPNPEDEIKESLAVDPMEMELGVGLIRLADPNRGGDLLTRIAAVRKNVAAEIGIMLPKVRIRDNMRLGEYGYSIGIASNPIAGGEVMPTHLLAMDSGMTTGDVPGTPVRDPAFNTPAVWIEPGMRDRAEMLGYTPVEPAAVLATHLQEVVRQHADELLTRDGMHALIEQLKTTSEALVNELIPAPMRMSQVQHILQRLLREEVSIRQLALILETLSEKVVVTTDPVRLTEAVRARLSRTICGRYQDDQKQLHVATMEPAIEDQVASSIEHNDHGLYIRMSPVVIERICEAIRTGLEPLLQAGHHPVVVCSPLIRPGLREITSSNLPRLAIISYTEIPRDVKLVSHSLIQIAQQPAAAGATGEK